MPKMYRARPGANFNDAQAQAIGGFLEKFASDGLTPERVVELAKPKNSVLHQFFEWDDDQAAHRHRLHQARSVMSHLEVVITVEDDQDRVRAWHSVTVQDDDDESVRRYLHVDRVMSEPKLSDQVIQRAMDEAMRWRHKHSKYKSVFGSVFQAIDTTARQVKKRTAKKRRVAAKA